MAKSFGNLFSSFGKSSNFTKNSNVTHLEPKYGNIHAMFQNGGSVNLGFPSKGTTIHNGSGASTIVLESGTRHVYDHATGQTRQV